MRKGRRDQNENQGRERFTSLSALFFDFRELNHARLINKDQLIIFEIQLFQSDSKATLGEHA